MRKPHQPRLAYWIDLVVGIALGVAVMTLYGLVGERDYQEEQAAFERACEMIEAGAWPAEVAPTCAGWEGDNAE